MNSITLGPSKPAAFPTRAFVLTCLIVSAWVHASETLRYLAFVMPMTREALPMLSGVAPMNLPVFLMFGLWDTLLVVLTVLTYWLLAAQFGASLRTAVLAGTVGWAFFFVLFWAGNLLMGVTRWQVVAVALPWAWLETVVSCVIARWWFQRLGCAPSR
jgi:hypothetical protein